jgi:hypothetical protein
MLSNGQLGVIKAVSDFRRERMCQLPNGTGVRVTDKLSADSVLNVELRERFRFEFNNGLRLQLFPIVGPRDS